MAIRYNQAEKGSPLKEYFEIFVRAFKKTCEHKSPVVSLSPTRCRIKRNIERKYFSYRGLKSAGLACDFLITSSSLRGSVLALISCFNNNGLSFLKPK
jgi:hypothetical protein